MKLLVCGGRDYRDRAMVWAWLDRIKSERGVDVLIVGFNPDDPKYQGADQLAHEWAIERGVPVKNFPADWKAFGRSAGPRRNQQMADEGPDGGISFPRDNGKWGDGTLDMIHRAKLGAKMIRVAA